jgi:CRP-like cAMP-binding protein
MKNTRLLRKCSDHFVDILISLLQQRFYAAGEKIHDENGLVYGLYFIRKGQIKVRTSQRPIFVRKFPSDYFGEEAYLYDSAKIEAIAVQESEVWFIGGNRLKGLFSNVSFSSDKELFSLSILKEHLLVRIPSDNNNSSSHTSSGHVSGLNRSISNRRMNILQNHHQMNDFKTLQFLVNQSKQQRNQFNLFHENGTPFRIWKIVFNAILVVNMILITFRMGFPFLPSLSSFWLSFDVLSDVFFLIDFILRSFVIIPSQSAASDRSPSDEEKGEEATDFWTIYTSYRASSSFLSHLIAVIPFGVVFFLCLPSSSSVSSALLAYHPALSFFRANKLVRVKDLISSYNDFKVSFMKANAQPSSSASSSASSIMFWKYFIKCFECFLLIIVIGHIISCAFMFFIDCELMSSSSSSSQPDFLSGHDLLILPSLNSTSASSVSAFDLESSLSSLNAQFSQYIAILYWVISFLTTVGYGDISPVTDGEKMFNVIFFCLGTALLGIIIGSFQQLATESDYSMNLFVKTKKKVESFLNKEKDLLSSSFTTKLHHYYALLWESFHGEKMEDLSSILSSQYYESFLFPLLNRDFEKIFFVRNQGKEFRQYLISKMKLSIYHADEVIFREGEAATTLYFLLNGEVSLFNKISSSNSNHRASKAASPVPPPTKGRRASNAAQQQHRPSHNQARQSQSESTINYSKITHGCFCEGDFFLQNLYFCSASATSSYETTTLLSLSYASFLEVLSEYSLLTSYRSQLKHNYSSLKKKSTENLVLGFNDHIMNDKMRKMLSISLDHPLLEGNTSSFLSSADIMSGLLLIYDILSLLLLPLCIAFANVFVLFSLVLLDCVYLLFESISISVLFLRNRDDNDDDCEDMRGGKDNENQQNQRKWRRIYDAVKNIVLFISVLVFFIFLLPSNQQYSSPFNIYSVVYLVLRAVSNNCWQSVTHVASFVSVNDGKNKKNKKKRGKMMKLMMSKRFKEMSLLMISLLYFMHLLSCGLCWIGLVEVYSSPVSASSSWITANELSLSSPSLIYVSSLYWTIYSLSTVGYGSLSLVTNVERFYAILIMIIGAMLTAYVSSLLSIIIESSSSSSCESDHQVPLLEAFNSYFSHHQSNGGSGGINPELISSIKDYFLYCNTQLNGYSDDVCYSLLPSHLRYEYSFFFIDNLLRYRLIVDDRANEMHQNGFIYSLCRYMKPYLAVPGEMLIKNKGIRDAILRENEDLFILRRGEVICEYDRRSKENEEGKLEKAVILPPKTVLNYFPFALIHQMTVNPQEQQQTPLQPERRSLLNNSLRLRGGEAYRSADRDKQETTSNYKIKSISFEVKQNEVNLAELFSEMKEIFLEYYCQMKGMQKKKSKTVMTDNGVVHATIDDFNQIFSLQDNLIFEIISCNSGHPAETVGDHKGSLGPTTAVASSVFGYASLFQENDTQKVTHRTSKRSPLPQQCNEINLFSTTPEVKSSSSSASSLTESSDDEISTCDSDDSDDVCEEGGNDREENDFSIHCKENKYLEQRVYPDLPRIASPHPDRCKPQQQHPHSRQAFILKKENASVHRKDDCDFEPFFHEVPIYDQLLKEIGTMKIEIACGSGSIPSVNGGSNHDNFFYHAHETFSMKSLSYSHLLKISAEDRISVENYYLNYFRREVGQSSLSEEGNNQAESGMEKNDRGGVDYSSVRRKPITNQLSPDQLAALKKTHASKGSAFKSENNNSVATGVIRRFSVSSVV